MTANLISAKQAAQLGIERLRKPTWANPLDHVKIDIFHDVRGTWLGPWAHLFSPINQAFNGRDPVDMLWIGKDIAPNAEEWLPYEGPLADSEAYIAAASG